jgi:hypothetical protein
MKVRALIQRARARKEVRLLWQIYPVDCPSAMLLSECRSRALVTLSRERSQPAISAWHIALQYDQLSHAR